MLFLWNEETVSAYPSQFINLTRIQWHINQSSWKECCLQLTLVYTSCLIAFLCRSTFIQHSILKDLFANLGIPHICQNKNTKGLLSRILLFTEGNFDLEEKQNKPKLKFSVAFLIFHPGVNLYLQWAGEKEMSWRHLLIRCLTIKENKNDSWKRKLFVQLDNWRVCIKICNFGVSPGVDRLTMI